MARKSLPQSEQCEKGLLSCFFSPIGENAGNFTYDKCLFRHVTEKWFHEPDRAKLFTALMEMKKEGFRIENVSVTQYCLDHAKRLDISATNIDSWINTIFGFIPNGHLNTDYYLDQLQKKAALRLAQIEALNLPTKIEQCIELQEVHDLLSGAFVEAKEMCAVHDHKNHDQEAMMGFLDEMEAIARGVRQPEFFKSGLPTVDDTVGGFMRGEVVGIRGRTGTGKSLLGTKFIVTNALGERNAKCAIFSYEMPYNQCMRRIVADVGGVDLASMRLGKYTKKELDAFGAATTKIMESNLRIFDQTRLKNRKARTFFSFVRREHKNRGLDMVMLDHLHLLKLGDAKSAKRTDEELHEFSAEFKAMCLELNIVGIILAQENTTGGTFGGTQVETDVSTSFSLTTLMKDFSGIKRIIGTDGAFCDKSRDGDLLGRKIPLVMEGKYARIYEGTIGKQ